MAAAAGRNKQSVGRAPYLAAGSSRRAPKPAALQSGNSPAVFAALGRPGAARVQRVPTWHVPSLHWFGAWHTPLPSGQGALSASRACKEQQD